MVSHINRTPKRHTISRKDVIYRMYRQNRSTRNQKTTNNFSDKPGIRPDHPRRRIEIPFCMVGGLRATVSNFIKIGQVASKTWGRNFSIHILLAIGLDTTACTTTVQAVIELDNRKSKSNVVFIVLTHDICKASRHVFLT